MFELLFNSLFEKRVKKNFCITFLRNTKTSGLSERIILSKSDFKTNAERERFFKAVFCLRNHI